MKNGFSIWLLASTTLAATMSGQNTRSGPLKSRNYGMREVAMVTEPSLQPRGQDVVAAHQLSIRRLPQQVSRSHKWLNAVREPDGGDEKAADENYNMTKLSFIESRQYGGSLNFGDEEFLVIIDTGSSDTWLVHENFTCLDYYSIKTDFGPVFNGTFQHGSLNGVKFDIKYGDGEFLVGQSGYHDVTVAGITVKGQQVSLVDEAYWNGDGVTSGILGLAYPFLTKAFDTANKASVNAPGSPNQVAYDPIFTNMYKQGLVPPVFSMAMDRATRTGWLALGGLPDMDYSSDFTSTPIRMLEIYDIPSMATEYSFYSIITDGFVLGTNTSGIAANFSDADADDIDLTNPVLTHISNDDGFPTIIDSGTTLIFLPSDIASQYASKFHPPAYFNRFTNQYWAPCNSTVPALGITIGGKTFFMNEDDLLQKIMPLDLNGDGVLYCTLGVMDGLKGPYVLGEAFMNNVISVFDVGKGEMRFAAVKTPQSGDSVQDLSDG